MSVPMARRSEPALVRQGVVAEGSPFVVIERAGRATLFGEASLSVFQGTPEAVQAELAVPEGDVRRALAARPSFRPAEDTPRVVTQLNIGNTHHCNLACTYCYNELPSQRSKGAGDEAWMTPDVARQMVDSLLAQSEDAPAVSLVWIGGEALLQKQLVMETSAYARAQAAALGKSANVVVYSNGVTLTREVVEWANTHEVSLVVSLDGPPRVQDRDRLFAGGRPSSPIVFANVRQFMELSTQPVRRVRAVAVQRQRQLPLHQYLFDLGFNEIQVQAAYDESGVDGQNGVADLAELLGWYETLLLSGVTIAIEPYATILERAWHGGEVPANYFPCGAGNSLLGVTPDGSVVACHHFVRDPRPPAGNVRNGLPGLVARAGLSRSVLEREPCRRCWARHLCGGDCYHRAYAAGHGYFGVMTGACDAKRELIAHTIELFARVSRRRPEVLGDLIERELTELAPNPVAYAAEDLSAYE